MDIRTKRIYDGREDGDGCRVLVDRLWPRGVKKQDAAIDIWAKEIAPSDALRREFHDLGPGSFDEFRDHYRAELEPHRDDLRKLLAEAAEMDGDVMTLLFGSKDTEHNNAIVLAEVLRSLDG